MEIEQPKLNLESKADDKKSRLGFIPWLAGGLGVLAIMFFILAWQNIDLSVTSFPNATPPKPTPLPQQTDLIGDLVKESISMSAKPENKTALLPRYVENAAFISPLPKGAKKIVIVIDDVGVTEHSKNVLTLPREVTLSFLPYGKFTADLSKQARARGHEVMVHLPMEPQTRLEEPAANPGPNALYVADNTAELKLNTYLNLKGLAAISVGVNNHMGSRFTADEKGMRATLEVIDSERLFFMDSLTTSNSAVKKAAKDLSLPLLRRDVFLDHYEGRENVDEALKKLEVLAKRNGNAIAIGHPHQNTVDAINDWAKTLKKKGIYLVPITELIND